MYEWTCSSCCEPLSQNTWKACQEDAPIAYAGLLMIVGNVHRSQQRFKDTLDLFGQAQTVFEAAGATATTDYLQLLYQIAALHYEQDSCRALNA